MDQDFSQYKIKRPFTNEEAAELYVQYQKDPGNLHCPGGCVRVDGKNGSTVEVLAFIDPEVDSDGLASLVQPEGEYAAAIYCHGCQRAIGIRTDYGV